MSQKKASTTGSRYGTSVPLFYTAGRAAVDRFRDDPGIEHAEIDGRPVGKHPVWLVTVEVIRSLGPRLAAALPSTVEQLFLEFDVTPKPPAGVTEAEFLPHYKHSLEQLLERVISARGEVPAEDFDSTTAAAGDSWNLRLAVKFAATALPGARASEGAATFTTGPASGTIADVGPGANQEHGETKRLDPTAQPAAQLAVGQPRLLPDSLVYPRPVFTAADVPQLLEATENESPVERILAVQYLSDINPSSPEQRVAVMTRLALLRKDPVEEVRDTAVEAIGTWLVRDKNPADIEALLTAAVPWQGGSISAAVNAAGSDLLLSPASPGAAGKVERGNLTLESLRALMQRAVDKSGLAKAEIGRRYRPDSKFPGQELNKLLTVSGNPGIFTLKAFADAVGVPVEELLFPDASSDNVTS